MSQESFDKFGFLADCMSEIENEVYEKNKDHFDVARSLNEECQKLKFLLHTNDFNGQKVLSIAAFIKALNSFQALLILANKGLLLESQIILRAMLETVIILKLLCEDQNFTTEYVRTDAIYRKKLLEAAKKNKHSLFDSTRELLKEGLLETVVKEIEEYEIKNLKIEQLATRASMSEFYDSVYRIESSACHTAPRSLEQYVVVNDKGEMKSFNRGPFSEVDLELNTAIGLLFVTVKVILKLFDIKEPEVFDHLSQRFIKLTHS